ncbi:mediator of RNA polymerase II transcription subunit, partial [Trifolium medium]|nr:mediator of RNA polymerase II transcription subunit [Trifolium medium]
MLFLMNLEKLMIIAGNFQDHQVAMPIGSSPCSINQPSKSKGPGNAVQHQTNIALEGFGESINSPKISASGAFSTGTKSNTNRISPLIKESSYQNQVSRKPTLNSEERSPAMQRLIKVLTSISPEALRAAVGEIEEVVHLNEELVDELGLPTFPEGTVLLL